MNADLRAYLRTFAKPIVDEQVPQRLAGRIAATTRVEPPALPDDHACIRDGCMQMRERGRESLFYFARTIVDWARPEEKNLIVEHLHQPLCTLVENPQYPKQLILIPRGCLKTTLLVEAYSLWCLVRDPMDTILLASATAKLAEHSLRRIKSVFERNELFRHLYGFCDCPDCAERDDWIVPLDFANTKWSETEIIMRRPQDVKEPSIQTIGVGGTIVGHHFRRAIYDDLINEKHRDSPTQMQEADDWLRYAVNLLEDPDNGAELIVGTHWGHDDIYARRKAEGQFALYQRSITENGVSIFPEKYPLEALERLKIRLGPYNYSANMMNYPEDPTRQIFRREWFPEIDYTPDLAMRIRGWRTYILLDPALSEKRDGSFTGYVIAVVGPDFETVVLEAIKRRWQTSEIIDRIFDDARRFDDHVDLVVELRSLAKFLKYPIEERMRRTGRFFGIIETPTPNTAKEERIRGSLVPPAANLRFRFIRGACSDLLQDARDFPFGDGNYDALDTLSFLPQVWREGSNYVAPDPDVYGDPFNMATILRELRERGAAGENRRFVLHRQALMGVN